MPPVAPLRRLVPLLALAGLWGCQLPAFDGPQIQQPPPGFTLNPRTALESTLFPDRELSHHDAWVRSGWGDFSGIYINGHPGTASREDAVAAQERVRQGRALTGDWIHDFGPVERISVDGQDAFGWSEMLHSPTQGIESVSYRAVVPYDTATYTVEFVSGDPSFKNRPDSLRTIVASFAIGRVRWNLPLILLLAGAALFLVARLRTRSQEKARRVAGMSLPKIPPREETDQDSGPAAGGPGGAAPPSP